MKAQIATCFVAIIYTIKIAEAKIKARETQDLKCILFWVYSNSIKKKKKPICLVPTKGSYVILKNLQYKHLHLKSLWSHWQNMNPFMANAQVMLAALKDDAMKTVST